MCEQQGAERGGEGCTKTTSRRTKKQNENI